MPPRLDVNDIKSAARGHWATILNRVAHISDDYITTDHVPCPRCGGTKPWRVYDDFAETGGALCNHCGKWGDGFGVIGWFLGVKFEEALALVADHLGIKPSDKPKRLPGVKISRPRIIKAIETKASDIAPIAWNDMQVALWCRTKKPITPDALKACGAYVARYKGKYTVIAIPCGKNWTLYNITGGTLPGAEKEWVKVKNVNKYPGWMGSENPSLSRSTSTKP